MDARAKFQCSEATKDLYGWKYTFMVVYDQSTPENQRFTKSTPSGTLTMRVDNPAVSFEPGKFYYLDIGEVFEATE
jgi:hypothetical protein